MAEYWSSAYVVVLLLLLDGFQVCFSTNTSLPVKNYITWDDLKLDGNDFVSVSNPGYEYKSSCVIVVDKNGGGNSRTVQGAIDMVPEHNTKRVKIYILPGTYREKIFIPSTKPYISFIGQRNHTSRTILTWHNKASDKNQYGIELLATYNPESGIEMGTYNSASVTIESDYFCASRITFENSAVPDVGGQRNQAVALRIAGDKAMFYKVKFLGRQDTLLDQTGTHFFYKCFIQGSVDFIFGRSRSLYKECNLYSIAEPYGAIAAHHRDSPDETGFSFVNCVITGSGTIYLGRAWGEYSRIIFSYCAIPDIIIPSGWSDWDQPSRHMTVEFGEYQCGGKGADTRQRVSWMKNFSNDEIRPFLDTNFINEENWLRL